MANSKSYYDKAISRSENSNNTAPGRALASPGAETGDAGDDQSYYAKSTARSENSNDTGARPKTRVESALGPETPNRLPTGGPGGTNQPPMRSRTMPAPVGRSGRGVPKE